MTSSASALRRPLRRDRPALVTSQALRLLGLGSGAPASIRRERACKFGLSVAQEDAVRALVSEGEPLVAVPRFRRPAVAGALLRHQLREDDCEPGLADFFAALDHGELATKQQLDQLGVLRRPAQLAMGIAALPLLPAKRLRRPAPADF